MRRTWILTLRTISLVLLAGLVAAVNGCDGWNEASLTFNSQPLRVVALKEPLSRMRLKNEGIEFDLLSQFASESNLKIKWKWVRTPEEALRALNEGRADVAAGRWSAQALHNKKGYFVSPAYETSPALLVCQKDLRSWTEKSFLENVLDRKSLAAPFWIENQSLRIRVHRRDLSQALQIAIRDVNPEWRLLVTQESALGMARMLNEKKADCFVTDQNTGRWLQLSRSGLRIVRPLDIKLSKAFVFSSQSQVFEVAYTSWFQKKNRQGRLALIQRRYVGFQDSLSESDHRGLLKKIDSKLAELKPHFEKVAREFQLPWELVAAVAYQESHWESDAQSHTGVKGIMQLTKETARHLGVENREDLHQSLWGGAKYIRLLIDQQPGYLHPRERLALALATYNVGAGHLRDAQKLAISSGHNPSSFWDLRAFLPLLSHPAVAAELEFGPARGEEPVIFTERVLAYYDFLTSLSEK